MARIAEELLLLQLDNAAARPIFARTRRQPLLAGAALLDLAYACRIRPAVAGEASGADRLLALLTPDDCDPVLSRPWKLLAHKPVSAAAAIARLGGHTERAILAQLEGTGQIRRMRVYTNRLRPEQAWQLTNRTRVASARAALLSALLSDEPPAPTTAALITLLHAVDGLGALLSLDPQGWQQAHGRAAEIASGSWVTECSGLAEVNLAVTGASVRAALA